MILNQQSFLATGRQIPVHLTLVPSAIDVHNIGALLVTYTILGVPYYHDGIVDLKTLF